MIGCLPKALEVLGVDYRIDSDYRNCLMILQAFGDQELDAEERLIITLTRLYEEWGSIPKECYEEALNKAMWFLNCGSPGNDKKDIKAVYNWEKDEQIIFSAVNKIAGREVRAVEYMHFWTFMSYFNEIGEGLFSSIVNIRNKKNKGKKLEKHEKEFYKENKSLIDITEEKKIRPESEKQALKALVGG